MALWWRFTISDILLPCLITKSPTFINRQTASDWRKMTKTKTFGDLVDVVVAAAIILAMVIGSGVAFYYFHTKRPIALMQSELERLASYLAQEYERNGTYPASLQKADADQSFTPSSLVEIQYTKDPEGENTYCATATIPRRRLPAFVITSKNAAPREGFCMGHHGPDLYWR